MRSPLLRANSSARRIVAAVPLVGLALALLAAAGCGTQPHASCESATKVGRSLAMENSCGGTSDWRRDLPTGPSNAIEAFSAPASVNLGENVKLFVSTTAPTYTFQVYRMGWYQGYGAHLVYTSSKQAGITQPPPTTDPTTRMVSGGNWHDPFTLPIPTTWLSGVYVVKLVSSAGFMRYTSFVVRNDASHAPILFQASILTYQAYNLWGGRSLYYGKRPDGTYMFADRSYAVSFDRPYAENAGLMSFVPHEFTLLQWLERQGYEVSYTTDIDTDQRGALLLNHRLLIVAGHDEYWSSAMRSNVEAGRNGGVSLAFFGSNDAYWHVRLQSTALGPDREVICYKDASLDPMTALAPQTTTVKWRDAPLNQPENSLLGEMYEGQVKAPAPLVLAVGAAPFLGGTALAAGSTIPGLVDDEYDAVSANGATPPSLTVIASSPLESLAYGPKISTATMYTVASSGAKVFDTGTLAWTTGFDKINIDAQMPRNAQGNADLQQFTANIVAYLLAR